MPDLQAVLLSLVPADGDTVGNGTLRGMLAEKLGRSVDEAEYGIARDALVAAGKLAKGRGRGGSVCLAAPTATASPKAASVAKAAKPPKAATQGHLGFEEKLWQAADLLRNNVDPSEYKHVVLGLLFLKYIEDAFEERRATLALAVEEPGSDCYVKNPADRPTAILALQEDRDEYTAENVFWVPEKARWTYLRGQAKLPTIGRTLDDAMDLIEKDNDSLRGVLPKIYAMPNLNKENLGKLIDLVSGIGLGSATPSCPS